MAYVTEQIITKARLALKALNKEYGIKATLSGKGDSTLYLTITEGKIDFISNFCENVTVERRQHDTQQVIDWVTKEQNISVNQYYLDSSFDGIALEYLEKAKSIMLVDHWDRSDIQSDYFNCAYYLNISIGRWNKPYNFVNKE
jgi:hypothetical protein